MSEVKSIPLPEAGHAVELHLTFGDLRTLNKHFGSEYVRLIDVGLNAIDLEVCDKFLSVAAKKEGKPFPVKFDSLDANAEVVRDKMRDAFTYCLAGLPYRDYVQKIIREAREFNDAIDAAMKDGAANV